MQTVGRPLDAESLCDQKLGLASRRHPTNLLVTCCSRMDGTRNNTSVPHYYCDCLFSSSSQLISVLCLELTQ
jgi:hypothetical protein